MQPEQSRTTIAMRPYLIGTVIVWAGLIIASAVVLSGTPYLVQILPILGGGAFFFVVLLPAAFSGRRRRRRS
jgi:hypothetical protein